MKESLDKLINEIESKIDLDFDFEIEHWENGNFDDSYLYGVNTGRQYTYREILVKLKELKWEL